MKKDERAHKAPHDTIFNPPVRNSLKPPRFPNPHLLLLGARLHDLLQIGQIIYFMLVDAVQFTHGIVVKSLIPLWMR